MIGRRMRSATAGLLLVALTVSACSDDRAPTASGLAMTAAEDAVDEVTTTTVPASTTSTTDPVALAQADFSARITEICDAVFAPVRGEPPDDLGAAVGWARALEGAYYSFADQVEQLTPPDRQTEANLVEGLRRLRRTAGLLAPAIQAAIDQDRARFAQTWYSFAVSAEGAARALYSAGIPLTCYQ